MMINLLAYVLFVSSVIHVTQCKRTVQYNSDPRWPVIYSNNEIVSKVFDPAQPISMYLDLIKDYLFMSSNESDLLPKAKDVTYYDQNSNLAKELQFVSALCKTTNCRESLDAWDCPICAEILPDAIVVRSFRTHPNDVTGQVLRSESYWSKQQLVDHPFIPNIRVQEGCLEAAIDIRSILRNTLKDQLTLFPDYKTAVIGHSFGAGVGSLVVIHLKLDFPQLNSGNFKAYLMAKSRIGDYNYAKYVAEQGIKILRVVNALDEVPHKPSLLDGYVHEGDEYWLRYFNDGELQLSVCPGPFETSSCSSSSPYFSTFEHAEVFGIQQSCYTDDSLHFNFTALMERLSNNIELASEEIQRAQEASKNQIVSQILL
ncbi:hypothetical protein G6F29_004681 [Rhizopus arrhizus]|nr:hypothetical protein G6F29_004681 [Rhizopus arrhizus]KAG1010274.1 hypothetical protein G6F27_004816 [Rhizopus arrhizus]KAG1026218.1 hypothetical protein G6F26_004474 [Rhizopus arrhizus]KAG1285147.1 hypothetical protein G6F65_003076 [Rhizopus arrhizus]KAG1351522.1 hypothetical protein G6F63_002874 [Rhizopus arrhizus]